MMIAISHVTFLPPIYRCKKCPPPVKIDLSVAAPAAAAASSNERALEGGHSLEELQRDMGLEMYGFVDGKQAFTEFLSFMPEKIKVRCFGGAWAECGKDGREGWSAVFSRASDFFLPLAHIHFSFSSSSSAHPLNSNRPTSTTKPWSS